MKTSKYNLIAVVAITGLVAFVSVASKKSEKKKIEAFANDTIINKKKVAPPIKGADLAYTNFQIQAAKESELTYATGSLIKIPANAFIDSKGKLIEGEVQIKYREFHNPADFFVSGIPMTYDSAGTQYHFESAGMLEILAFQNNLPVFLKPEKSITVEMISQQKDDKYNIYQYDSVTGNWQYMYKDVAKEFYEKNTNENNVISSAEQKLKNEKTEEETFEPIMPRMANKNALQFTIETDEKEFPELALFKDVHFEVNLDEPNFNSKAYNITWDNLSLKKSQNKGSYILSLVQGANAKTFEAYPVLDSVNYEAAFEVYTKELLKKTLKAEKNEIELKLKKNTYSQELKLQYDVAKSLASAYGASQVSKEVVVRTFTLKGFGIFNSDCPSYLPKGEDFFAMYVDSTGKKIEFNTLYLAEKGRNAMFAITSYNRLYFNPAKDNLLWAVTTDNKFAYVSEEKFKKLKEKNDSCTVVFDVMNKPITKGYEVQSLLKL